MSKNRERLQVDLDPSVAEALAAPPGRRSKLHSNNHLLKVTVRLPEDLVAQIKAEAYALTHHKRRGFQDLIEIFLRHGLQAYQNGELEVTLAERIVEYRIVAKQ